MSLKTGFRVVFVRECKRIISSKICIWGMIIAPLLTFAILMYMMSAGLPTKIPVAVVDLDNSSTSRALVRQLDAFAKTDIKFKSLSFKEARIAMERAEVYGIFTIPEDFAKDAVSGNRPKIVFYTNNAFLISGSLLFQDMKMISVLASASVGLKMGEAKGYTQGELMPVLQPISIEAHVIGNPMLNYSVYLNNVLTPGILFLILAMFTISALGSEVKSGTGRQLLDLSGGSIVKAVFGKLLPYTALFLILSLFFMSVLYGYNHFPLHSGFWPMCAAYLCLILSAQGFGLILLAVFPNYRLALSSASLLGMISFSITGFSFASMAMSPILYGLSFLFPLRHFFLIYVDQALNGIPLGYSAYHYAALLGFFLVGLLLMGRIRRFLYENVYEE
ncbi:ABC transporter permease [Dysgonomonas capnocytophagoides]|uniref:ABC transporter permease n=1 Tax=Dysgonomonas capnocytophagoides TaxID=45254 RepID=UPI003340550A